MQGECRPWFLRTEREGKRAVMTLSALIPILPLLILGLGAVVVMLQAAFYRHHALTWVLTLLIYLVALGSLPFVARTLPAKVTSLVLVDPYALYFLGLMLAGGLIVAVLSFGYLRGGHGNAEEYYVLLLLATLGAAVLVVSSHFATFFLGLELLSVPLYVMICYPKAGRARLEAGFKYLILSAAASAFLLLGMAFLYDQLGTLEFSGLMLASSSPGSSHLFLLTGYGLLAVGVGFELALVPFHVWTPDVYQGAPAPVSGFIATVSKGSLFVLFLRLFGQAAIHSDRSLWWMFAVLCIASMLAGNLLALVQSNLKRILAYSSIAHLGYLLIPFLALGPSARPAVAFYLTAYFAITLSAFGVVGALSSPEHEVEDLEEYRGLFYRRPGLAILLTMSLVALAGVPPTAGLLMKFYIVTAGMEASLWFLLILLVIASVVGVFYYLRVALVLFRRPSEEPLRSLPVRLLSRGEGIALVVLAGIVMVLGVYPTPFLQFLQRVVYPIG